MAMGNERCSFEELLHATARRAGYDVASEGFAGDVPERLTGFVEERLRQAWQEEFWPWGVTRTERRQFAPDWDADTIYAAGDVVLSPKLAYMEAVAGSVGVDPDGPDAYLLWRQPTDFVRRIAYDQPWEARGWADCQDVFGLDPRRHRRAMPLAWDLDADGLVVTAADCPARVWCRLRSRSPRLVLAPVYMPDVAYRADTIVFDEESGDCWEARRDTVAGEEPGAWVEPAPVWELDEVAADITRLTQGDGVYVGLKNNVSPPIARVSFDGETWQSAETPAGVWQELAFANGRFMAVASGGTNRIMSSDDGLNWVARYQGTENLYGIAYGDGVWIAVGLDGKALRSADNGVTWALIATGIKDSGNRDAKYYGVAFGAGVWVAVSNNDGYGAMTARSTDGGLTWSPIADGGIWDVVYGNGYFVSVGDHVWRSVDGSTWTKVKDRLTLVNAFRYVNFLDGKLVIGSFYGNVFESTDGETWTERDFGGPITTGASVVGIAILRGVWLVAQTIRTMRGQWLPVPVDPWVKQELPRAFKPFVVAAAAADELGTRENVDMQRVYGDKRAAAGILDDLVDRTFAGQGEIFRAIVEVGN
jgi:hypothetical protein